MLDFEIEEAGPAPLTTIAWRLNHVFTMFEMRWEWTFGSRSRLEESVDFSPSATVALERLWVRVDRWVADSDALSDERVDQVGLSQFPHGLDPKLPFAAIVWWVNRELIHHTAEMSLLRDLYIRRSP